MDASLTELLFLQRLSLVASTTLDAGELVDLVIAETTEALRVDVCSVYLLQEDGETLLLAATNGLSQAGVGRVRLRIGEGVTGWAARERTPVVVPDVREEERFRWLHGVDQARFVSMCSVPVIAGDRLVGVLNVQTDTRRDLSGQEVDVLAAIAATVAGALERSSLQRGLEARLADLRRSEEIHRRFTELALTGAGLGTICTSIARHAGVDVALYDDDGRRLAPPGPDGLPDVLRGYVDPARRDDGLSVIPVRAGRDMLGWLAAAPGDDDQSLARRLALEHGVTVLALELSRERAEAEAERRLRGDLVEELLTQRLTEADADHLAQRAARLGYRLADRMWALVVQADDPSATRALTARATARRLVRAIQAAAAHEEGTLVVERAGGVVILVPDTVPHDRVEALAWAVLTAAGQAAAGASFSCGVCGDPGAPADLRRAAEEARAALAVGLRLGNTGSVAAYRRLGVERLLLETPQERLNAFVDEWIGPLVRHQSEGRAAAPLVDTVEALAAEGWNLRAAARRLNVHVNTLLYRVERARALSGRDLDDTDVRLAMAVAIRARALTAL